MRCPLWLTIGSAALLGATAGCASRSAAYQTDQTYGTPAPITEQMNQKQTILPGAQMHERPYRTITPAAADQLPPQSQ